MAESPQHVQEIFEPHIGNVRMARELASVMAKNWGFDPGPVEMVVGELAANAVVHGRSRFRVQVLDRDDRIRVSVQDNNPRLPIMVTVPPDAHSGRGLRIVQELSRAWGIRSIPDDGKVVWAELDGERERSYRDKSFA